MRSVREVCQRGATGEILPKACAKDLVRSSATLINHYIVGTFLGCTHLQIHDTGVHLTSSLVLTLLFTTFRLDALHSSLRVRHEDWLEYTSTHTHRKIQFLLKLRKREDYPLHISLQCSLYI